MKTKALIITLFLLVLLSCRQVPERAADKSGPGKREMADLNRYFIQKDKERIESYIERRDLKMNVSPSGLWYGIISGGEGELLSDNYRIIMEYKCSLLDGTVCYSSDEDGTEEIIIGRSDIPAGLTQGLKMLRYGGEAILIIPPYLAFGLKGDGKRIPARSVIVYEIKILKENNSN